MTKKTEKIEERKNSKQLDQKPKNFQTILLKGIETYLEIY
jgi:hypothetical protein